MFNKLNMKKQIYLIAFLFILTSCNKLSSIETLFYDEVILNDEYEYFANGQKYGDISATSDDKSIYFLNYYRGVNQEFLQGNSFRFVGQRFRKILEYKGRPFTGILKSYYFERETLKKLTLRETSIYKDGKLNGPYKLYNHSEQPEIEANFKNGYLDGNYKYFADWTIKYDIKPENRIIAHGKEFEANFKDGLLDGKSTRYDSKGKPILITIYSKGNEVSHEIISNSSDENNIDSTFMSTETKINTDQILNPLSSIQTVKIGDQEWMTEDIKVTVYNNEDPIYEAKQDKQWKDCGDKKKGCYRKLSNGTFVYNGFAINDKRGLLPSGFIIPKYEQFNQLVKFLGGGDTQAGKAIKSLATYSIYLEEYDEKNGGIKDVEIKTNGKSGFKAKEGGFVYDHGALDNEGNCSFWWTSTTEGEGTKEFDIGYCSQDLGGGFSSFSSSFGFAVRAIKK